MSTNIKIKGNGEEVIITRTGHKAGMQQGRIYLVKPGMYDLIDESGVSHRISAAEIADISEQ